MIDANCHLDDPALDAERGEIVSRARAAGVRSWIISGTQPSAWARTLEVAAATGGVGVLGVHPWYVDEVHDTLVEVLGVLRDHDPAGIGEIGLDAWRGPTPEQRSRQRTVLRAQLALARELDRPVSFHCVRAFPELLTMIARDGLPSAGGMIHGWSGPADQALRAVELGLYVSFGPLVCQPRARRVQQAATMVPLPHLLVETDAPDQPLPGQGRGEPADLGAVVARIAQLRGIPIDSVTGATTNNASRLWADCDPGRR